jgi:nitric oxide dioxygenase
MGEFSLDRSRTTPVVLISGGVGITPMVSMLASLVAQKSKRRIAFVHACRNGRVHAFGQWLDAIAAKHPNVSRTVFYEKTHADDRLGSDFDFAGRMDFARIADQAVLPDADYYLCGPVPFMRAQQEALIAAGVQKARVRTEIYGSGEME